MPKSGQNSQNGDFANFIAHEPLTFSSWCKGESCIEWSKLCDDIFFVSWSCLCREWVISDISLWNFYWLRFSSNSLSHREPFVENPIQYKTSLYMETLILVVEELKAKFYYINSQMWQNLCYPTVHKERLTYL